MHRTVTDAKGSRWDVNQQDGDGGDGRKRIEFRHQSGSRYQTESRLGVDELSDRQLLEMLEGEAQAENVTSGPERSADPDGYITR